MRLSELSSYSLTDLLLFNAETYFRLFGLYHRAVWPWGQALAVVGALILLVAMMRPTRSRLRAAFGVLALAWIATGYGFFQLHYATINWAAPYVVPAAFLQGGVLAWLGLRAVAPRPVADADRQRWLASGFLIIALILTPLFGWSVAGRPIDQVALFGMFPDPTAFATLAVLLISRGPAVRLAWPIPLAWIAIAVLTAYVLLAAG